MKSQVLHTVVMSNISGEAAGETWNSPLLGVTGLMVGKNGRTFSVYGNENEGIGFVVSLQSPSPLRTTEHHANMGVQLLQYLPVLTTFFLPQPYRPKRRPHVQSNSPAKLFVIILFFVCFQSRCPSPDGTIADLESIIWSPVRNDDISWNFEKILVDHVGRPVRRYKPSVDPTEITHDISTLIQDCEETMKGGKTRRRSQ